MEVALFAESVTQKSLIAMDEPREALPPCIRGLSVFEGHQVCWHDMDRCPMPVSTGARHVITAGKKAGRRNETDCADGAIETVAFPSAMNEGTDDEIEAKLHYERGIKWLRGLTANTPLV